MSNRITILVTNSVTMAMRVLGNIRIRILVQRYKYLGNGKSKILKGKQITWYRDEDPDILIKKITKVLRE